MTDKVQNLIVRTITGVLFVAIMVTCFLNPFAMVLLFALVTGLTIWEYCGLVNNVQGVTVNRFISTVAGVYFFVAVAGVNSGTIQTNAVFVPYLLTIVYLFVSELYAKAANAVNDWAYTMLAQMYIALPLAMINVLAFRQSPDQSISFYYLLPPLAIYTPPKTNRQPYISTGEGACNKEYGQLVHRKDRRRAHDRQQNKGKLPP